MLDWISGWVGRFTGTVDRWVIQLVHWGLHALAAVIETVFRDVTRSWRDFWGAVVALERALADIGAAVYGLAVRVLKYWVPRLWRYITEAAAALARAITWVWHRAVRIVAELRATVWGWLLGLWRMVLRDVWAPLKADADHLWHLLVTWGYTAWWWITHLESLAEAMIWHLAAAIERHAWQLGARMGQFVTALVLHNTRRLVQLAETILAAVL